MIEGQEGVDWRLWKHLAETVEGLGFDSFWRSDHLYSVFGEVDRDTIECWASLAHIATWTRRIPFGPNVSPMTFREPGLLAKTAASVDVLSGGRLVMGVGAGWYESEHRNFAIPFPPLKERMDRMDAAFGIMEDVWKSRNPRPVRRSWWAAVANVGRYVQSLGTRSSGASGTSRTWRPGRTR